jgi:ribosomal protein S18 acetylase RimI-like enzyme
LGYIDGKLAAFVVAQVRPDGWSRITYMGVHPDFRGKGLGKWVHRRGFAMMKKLGGKDYFGGTVSTNKNMVKLFQEHGCRGTRVLEEWVWKK